MGWIFEPPNPLWKKALATRTYYYLYKWTWYEWLGALAPLVHQIDAIEFAPALENHFGRVHVHYGDVPAKNFAHAHRLECSLDREIFFPVGSK